MQVMEQPANGNNFQSFLTGTGCGPGAWERAQLPEKGSPSHGQWQAELAWLCPVWASANKGSVFLPETTTGEALATGIPGSDGTNNIKAAPAVVTS